MIIKIIDPHLHLFDLQRGKYTWLKSENPPFWPDKARINKNFFDRDLCLSAPLDLYGFVHIEAGFDNDKPWREIAWLEKTCSLSFKSIASVSLTHTPAVFLNQLQQLKQFQSVAGVRHILDDALFQTLINRNIKANVTENLKQLADSTWIFEAQLDVNNTEKTEGFIDLITDIPTLRIALNHAGFPPCDNAKGWKANINTLARLPQIWVKASGWEMSNRQYPIEAIEQRVIDLIDAFGENRVMLASNFPLTLFRTSYDALWHSYRRMALPTTTSQKLSYLNAKQFYFLS